MTYPNEALTEICKLLMDEWELTPEQIANLANDIPRECKNIQDNRDEAAWEAWQERLMSDGGPHDASHRDNIIAAGRGHLLR